jgi:small-conductance mechanosensitive channel
MRRHDFTMSSAQPGRTDKARRQLHYVLRVGNPELATPMLASVERWNWAVRISVVGLFVVALVVIAFEMASVVVPVLLAWVVAMVLLPVVDGLERRGLPRALTSIVLVILLIASILVIIGVLMGWRPAGPLGCPGGRTRSGFGNGPR